MASTAQAPRAGQPPRYPPATELAGALANELKLGVLLVDSSWHRLREAGLPLQYGEVLSDNMQKSLELNEISCVLAATSNDAYNALVCYRLTSDLGHGQVFQLPIYEGEEDSKALARKKEPEVHLRLATTPATRSCGGVTSRAGSSFKTRLTEGYTHEDFLGDCPEEMILIGVAREDGSWQFHAPAEPVKPKTGETLYSTMRPDGRPRIQPSGGRPGPRIGSVPNSAHGKRARRRPTPAGDEACF